MYICTRQQEMWIKREVEGEGKRQKQNYAQHGIMKIVKMWTKRWIDRKREKEREIWQSCYDVRSTQTSTCGINEFYYALGIFTLSPFMRCIRALLMEHTYHMALKAYWPAKWEKCGNTSNHTIAIVFYVCQFNDWLFGYRWSLYRLKWSNGKFV